MKYNIYKNELVDRKLWIDLLNRSEFASPFQTPEFFDFFNQNANMQADVFAVGDVNTYSAICVVTLQKEKGIRGYFSRRAIVYGGPLISRSVSEYEINFLLKSINSFYKSKAIYLETRNFFDYSSYTKQFQNVGFKYVPWLNFHLNTTSIEDVKSRISKSRLRQIKKAQKQGVAWKVAESVEEVKAFYDILNELYLTRIKKPLFAIEFFINFFKSNVGKYLLVIYNQKVIGGIMCPVFSSKGIYEYYVCGKDSDYKEQYPSIMATWAAIEYANQNNIPLFDFMGAGKPDEEYGVRDFKARFGGEQVEHGRFIKVLNPFLYAIGKLGLKVLSKLK
jgi:lipid II:glycine glycyltransferase (peptidoglycan interpeptide bridge formation enzyme)